jgi:hypothetical protein
MLEDHGAPAVLAELAGACADRAQWLRVRAATAATPLQLFEIAIFATFARNQWVSQRWRCFLPKMAPPLAPSLAKSLILHKGCKGGGKVDIEHRCKGSGRSGTTSTRSSPAEAERTPYPLSAAVVVVIAPPTPAPLSLSSLAPMLNGVVHGHELRGAS